MTRNPFGINVSEQAEAPTGKPRESGWQSLLVGALLGAAVLLFIQRVAPVPDADRDRQEQVDPSSTVAAKTKKIVIVDETGDSVRFPHVATLKMQDDYWDALETRGIAMRPYERDSGDLSAALRTAAESVGLPAILFLDASDKVIAGKTVPASTQGVDEILESKL